MTPTDRRVVLAVALAAAAVAAVPAAGVAVPVPATSSPVPGTAPATPAPVPATSSGTPVDGPTTPATPVDGPVAPATTAGGPATTATGIPLQSGGPVDAGSAADLAPSGDDTWRLDTTADWGSGSFDTTRAVDGNLTLDEFVYLADISATGANVWTVDADDRYVYYGDHDGTIYVHERNASAGFPLVTTLTPDGNRVNSVDSDGERIFYATDGGEVGAYARSDFTKDWSTATGGEVMMVDVDDDANSTHMVYAVNNGAVYMASQTDGSVAWSSADGQNNYLDSATIGPQYVYSGDDSNAYVHDHAGNLVYTPESPDCCKETIVPGPNGYFYLGDEASTVGVYDGSDGTEAYRHDVLAAVDGLDEDYVYAPPSSMAVDPAGDYLYVQSGAYDEAAGTYGPRVFVFGGIPSDLTLEASWPLANGGIDDYDTDSVYADGEYFYFSGDGGNVSVVDKHPASGTYANTHDWGTTKRFRNVTVDATVDSNVTLVVGSDVDGDGTAEDTTAIDLNDGVDTYDLSALPDGTRTTVEVLFGPGSENSSVDAVEVNAADLPEFRPSVDATNSPVREGDVFTVDATVANAGDLPGTQTVTLTVGGVERDARELALAGGESRTVSLSWSTGDGDAGSYTATVGTANGTASTPVDVGVPGLSIAAEQASTGSGVRVEVSAGEPLSAVAAEVVDGDGTTVATLGPGEFGTGRTVAATAPVPADGVYTVRLVRAEDGAGSDGADGQTATVRVDTDPPDVTGFSLTRAGDDALRVTLTSDEPLSTLRVRVVPPGTAEPYLELVRPAFDADARDGEIRYAVDVRVPATGTYEAELVSAADGSGNSGGVGATDTATVSGTAPDDDPPTVAAFDAALADDGAVNVTVETDEPLAAVEVGVFDGSGDRVATLNGSAFATVVVEEGTVRHRATVEVEAGGDLELTLETAADDAGNDGATGQTATVTVPGGPTDPVDRADENDDGAIDTDELQGAIADWARGEYTTEELRAIIAAWASS